MHTAGAFDSGVVINYKGLIKELGVIELLLEALMVQSQLQQLLEGCLLTCRLIEVLGWIDIQQILQGCTNRAQSRGS